MEPSSRAAFVLSLMLVVLTFGAVAGAQTKQAGSDDPPGAVHPDPLQVDAAEVAAMFDITIEEARARLERQPRVGELDRALNERGPHRFGGLMIDQRGEYAIVLLARPGGKVEVDAAVERLGFADLNPFITVRETPYTLDVLEEEMQRVGQLAGGLATTLDVDLRTGEVLATAATPEDVQALRDAVALAKPPIQARQVVVVEGGPSLGEHSYGGLALSTCTSGFSVRNTNTGTHGVSTAGHCQEAQTLQKHGVALYRVAEKEGDSQDVQWHTTPDLNDPNLINPRDGSGTERTITSRTDRSQMTLDNPVCHSGMTTQYGCGSIRSKSFDPDGSGSAFNGTFIRIRDDDTQRGDSGGPWFLGNSAYGTHRSSTTDGSDNPIFMAQNYMAALDIVVRITN